MHTERRLVSGLSAALVALALAAGPALAQNDAVIPEQDERQTLTDDLIGMPVYTRAGTAGGRDRIGSVESLLLNENDRLTGVIVSVGGFLGFGAKSIALDWNAVQLEQYGDSGYVANVYMTRRQLEEAPAFKNLVRRRAEEKAERVREDAERQRQELLEQQEDEAGTDTAQ